MTYSAHPVRSNEAANNKINQSNAFEYRLHGWTDLNKEKKKEKQQQKTTTKNNNKKTIEGNLPKKRHNNTKFHRKPTRIHTDTNTDK